MSKSRQKCEKIMLENSKLENQNAVNRQIIKELQ